MSGINFLSENFYKVGDLSLTTGTANAQFPVTNTQNDSPSVKFRSTGNTVVVQVDMGQTRAVDTLALVGDPTDSFGMTTVTFKTSVTTDFSGSPVNAVTLYPEQNLGIAYITEVSHRYIEISFTGQGSYVEVGNVFAGKRINLPQNNLSIGSFQYGYTDRSKVRQNNYGQSFVDQYPLVKSLSGALENCTLAEQESIDDIYLKHGIHEPLWLIADRDADGLTDGDSKLTVYGYFTSQPSWSAAGGKLYNTNLTVRAAV